ncbi:hypothetical protein ZWY2020_030742 [Hordeum vulgare]|nr:hypothetical protein ZWY2020_030742 [Hordeum vulgare]
MTGADALVCPALAALLSPAKREKKGPGCLETSPAVPAMVTEDWSRWSTLPPDLVRRIADSFLYTYDVGCYMDMRAVCPSWRAATDDPKDNASDHRFNLRRWVVLDDPFQSEGKPMLLLDADTGRFRHRKLPLPSDHYVVLADKRAPHAASVLNPLTGAVVRFAAPVPAEVGGADVVFDGSTLLKLVLVCGSSRTHYTAGPDSRCFTVNEGTGARQTTISYSRRP